MRFPIAIKQQFDTSRHYQATAPDLPDVISRGNSVEDALQKIEKAIAQYIELNFLQRGCYFMPHPIEEHLEKPEFTDCESWAIIDIDIYNTGKANTTH